jgi:DNA-binding SARP family transcriptional activator
VPRTAKGALQNYVSLLRKRLGADVLVTRGAGSLLAISPERTDAGRFEQLRVEASRAATAKARGAKLHQALGF